MDSLTACAGSAAARVGLPPLCRPQKILMNMKLSQLAVRLKKSKTKKKNQKRGAWELVGFTPKALKDLAPANRLLLRCGKTMNGRSIRAYSPLALKALST